MASEKYVIGLDYGSDSCRAVVVDAATGREMASAVKYYPRWMEGKYCDPAKNQYRQHPLDYIEGLEATVKDALAQCPAGTAQNVVGRTVVVPMSRMQFCAGRIREHFKTIVLFVHF